MSEKENEVTEEKATTEVTETPEVKSKDEAKAVLDNAFKERDKAQKMADRLLAENELLKSAQVEKEAEVLEAQGKKTEALEKRLASERDKVKDLELRNTVYTRDHVIEAAIATSDVKFQSPSARQHAITAIAGSLKYSKEDTSWSGADGKSISDAVKDFLAHEDNAYLMDKNRAQGTGALSSIPSANSVNPAIGSAIGGKSFKDVKKNDAEFIQWMQQNRA